MLRMRISRVGVQNIRDVLRRQRVTNVRANRVKRDVGPSLHVQAIHLGKRTLGNASSQVALGLSSESGGGIKADTDHGVNFGRNAGRSFQEL